MKTPENCIFYQTIDIPGIGVVDGAWDHRDGVDSFLGHVDFAGKSVLDVGPANGFFSFEMEKRGARVTALDLGEDSPWDTVPHPYMDETALKARMAGTLKQVENAFWLAHRAMKSKVQLVYGTVYDTPKLVARTDIAVMTNVLQHFRDPLMAIQRVAEIVSETLLITETLWSDDDGFTGGASMRLLPRSATPEVAFSWWQVSPTFVIELLKLLGFVEISYEEHEQGFNGSASDARKRTVRHFTVTARRSRALDPATRRLLEIGFAEGFHNEERDANHRWQWSSGASAKIVIANSSAQDIIAGITFGLNSLAASADVQVSVDGRQLWRATIPRGIQPVRMPSVRLAPGCNTMELTSSGGATATPDGRVLGFAVHDFELCEPLRPIEDMRPSTGGQGSGLQRLGRAAKGLWGRRG